MSLPGRFLLGIIKAYRLVSTRLPRQCRFEPTCSAYAEEAIRTHGAAHGGLLALRRILRCHPWNPGGIDRVPGGRHT